MSAQQGQQIDVTSLGPSELLEVRQQLTSELEHLTSSYAQLRSVQARFRACIAALDHFTSTNDSKSSNKGGDGSIESLIPLTSSLYVPGRLSHPDKVIVDVGTGYYVQRSTKEAAGMYKRKMDYVGGNLEKLQETMQRKQDNLRVVGELLQVVSVERRRRRHTSKGKKKGA